LRHAIAAGIGLFIAFIGLRLTGLVLPHPSNLVQLGNLREPMTYLTLIGLAVTLLLMAGNMRHICWDEFDESFPAFLVILTMPLTSSIATGIAFGFASYPLLKVASGKWREVHPLVYVFGLLFLFDLIFLAH